MPRGNFDHDIEKLIAKLIEMGRKVDEVAANTITVLKKHDVELARSVASSDDEIDAMEHRIEQRCMNLIARQAPIARDLRVIAATLKIITDIERVADQCADICEIMANVDTVPNIKPMVEIPRMCELARDMFNRAVDAYLKKDVEAAKKVCEDDDQVDELFSHIILELSALLTAGAQYVMAEVDLMFVTKYIERMADHATNIAEWTIYMVTGTHPDLNSGGSGLDL